MWETQQNVRFLTTPEIIATPEILSPMPIPIPISFTQLLSSIQEDSQEPEWVQQGSQLKKTRKQVASSTKLPPMHSLVPEWVECSHHDDNNIFSRPYCSHYGEYTQDLLLIAYRMQRMVVGSEKFPLSSSQATLCSPMRGLGLREPMGGRSYRKKLGSICWNRCGLGGPLPSLGLRNKTKTSGNWTRDSSMPQQRELNKVIEMDIFLPRGTGDRSNEMAVTVTRNNTHCFSCTECARYAWHLTSGADT